MSSTVEQLIGLLEQQLAAEPPDGVTREQVENFFARNRGKLADLLSATIRRQFGASAELHAKLWNTVRLSLVRRRNRNPDVQPSEALQDILAELARPGLVERQPGEGRNAGATPNENQRAVRFWARHNRDELATLARETWEAPAVAPTADPVIMLTQALPPALEGQETLPKGSMWRVAAKFATAAFFTDGMSGHGIGARPMWCPSLPLGASWMLMQGSPERMGQRASLITLG